MRRAQLLYPAVAVALAATIGCNRAETTEHTQRAAADVKTAAAKAGETLADGWVTTRIQAQYFADDQVKARYLDVSTRDKVVTIKGFVDSPAARDRALAIARTTSGVKEVNDQLLIGQSPQAFESARQPVATSGISQPAPVSSEAPLDDSRLTNSIQAKFFLDPTIKARHIDVDARSGIVTLQGTVASEAERAEALLLTRTAEGVQRVEDHLTVDATVDQPATAASQTRTPADDATLATSVKSSLAADPRAKSIDVTVQDGVVQLQGTVASAAARQRAIDLVRQTDGVTQVVDRLRVGK